MKTKQIYYQDPYKAEIEAVVLEIQGSAGSLLSNIVLNQTIFFPEGGGQPGDKGEIVGKSGNAKIGYTRLIGGEIAHQGKIIDNLAVSEKITARVDWKWRYGYMKIHTAGHLVHDVLMTMSQGLKPLEGSHGQKAFLEYEGILNGLTKEDLEAKVNEVAAQDLSIVTKEATYDELVRECQFVPPSLPKDKPLRMIEIGDFPSMPDGGVHVRGTREIGQILIKDLISQTGLVTVKYRVVGS